MTSYDVRYPLENEIWLANLQECNQGKHIQKGIRYILITSNNYNNKYSDNINYIPFTSNISKILPCHVLFKKGEVQGLYKDSLLLVESSDTTDKEFLIKPVGKLNEKQLIKVAHALIVQFPLLSKLYQNVN